MTQQTSDRATVLADWLGRTLGRRTARVEGLAKAGEGNSNETLLFTLHSDGGEERLVLRVQPTGHTLFQHPDAVREAAVLQAAGGTPRLPVPEVLGVEPSNGLLGAPFFVMRALPGRVLPDVPSCHAQGWLTTCTPEVRRRMWEQGIDALVAVTRVPVEPLRAVLGAGGLKDLVVATRRWFDWALEGRPAGVLGQAMTYLEQRLPAHDDAVLSWGDSRMGNLLFAEDGAVEAVLDWEMAALAPAEVDLGWWLMMEEFYSVRLGAQPLPGVPAEQEQIARWERAVGRPARELLWYRMLAGVRFGIVLVRARDLNVQRGLLSADSTMHTHSPLTQMLASWLGEPEPELAPEFAGLLAAYEADRVR
jgi:aminoglycoside phosphotransferase (APT) family kinase protein